MKGLFKLTLLFLFMFTNCLYASNGLKLIEIKKDIFAIEGDLGNRSPTNFGNNATFGFVITKQGVVLIDSGGSYQGAKEIHDLIKTVTQIPIKKVINTGGQDHRWFGNDYYKQLGAEIISSNAALKDHNARFSSQYARLSTLIGDDSIKGTEAVTATSTFDNQLNFTFGDVEFQLTHVGQAHTPGDAYVWLPQHEVVFTGDIVYVTRMLGVGSQSNSQSWVTVFESMAKLQPKWLVPGHGSVVSLSKAKKDTYEYLLFLREKVADFMDNDGDLSEISSIDCSSYNYLLNYDSLSGRNAAKVYTELEWE